MLELTQCLRVKSNYEEDVRKKLKQKDEENDEKIAELQKGLIDRRFLEENVKMLEEISTNYTLYKQAKQNVNETLSEKIASYEHLLNSEKESNTKLAEEHRAILSNLKNARKSIATLEQEKEQYIERATKAEVELAKMQVAYQGVDLNLQKKCEGLEQQLELKKNQMSDLER